MSSIPLEPRMSRARPFKQVDVFSHAPFGGNPLAVVLDAQGLSASDMQAIARWTNLSETTFVFPPERGGDYKLRIFTPKSELPFAGHPTLGSAHALREAGLVAADKSMLFQECVAGLIRVRVEMDAEPPRLFFELPTASCRALDVSTMSVLSKALGAIVAESARPFIVDVGAVWLVVDLGSASSVSALEPDLAAIEDLSRSLFLTGITVFGRVGRSGEGLRVRSFAPAHGVPEDPACGSGNGAVAAYLLRAKLLEDSGHHYQASQGRDIGRDASIDVRINAEAGLIEVGGVVVTRIDGRLLF